MTRYFNIAYTRPKKVDDVALEEMRATSSDGESTHAPGTPNYTSDGSLKSGRSGNSTSGIPDSLSFDKIISGGTCPPMTTRDFMNYLIYVEHAAENLQFFLWYKDYVKRFASANTGDMKLAPEWTQAMQDEAVAKIRKDNAEKQRAEPAAAKIFKGTDFDNKKGPDTFIQDMTNANGGVNPFHTPPRTPNSGDQSSIYTASNAVSSTVGSYQSQASDAFQAAGAKQPFTIQPFREEINRVISTYIMDDAPRQLNLAGWEQKTAVQALSYTTHPSALRGLIKTIESSLRRQAHPNFVRWSICNGNPARVFFARGLGVGTILIGFVIAIIMTLSSAGRGWRALAAIAWVLGISTLVAAYKGMCVVLHGMHHRHIRPWELFTQGDDEVIEKRSFESFGSMNSYEDEPWVVKYEKRNVVRKVFDREVWIQEPALRQIQDIIFVQALMAAAIGGGILTAIFVVLPHGNLF